MLYIAHSAKFSLVKAAYLIFIVLLFANVAKAANIELLNDCGSASPTSAQTYSYLCLGGGDTLPGNLFDPVPSDIFTSDPFATNLPSEFTYTGSLSTIDEVQTAAETSPRVDEPSCLTLLSIGSVLALGVHLRRKYREAS
jgi:hypothetical protein